MKKRSLMMAVLSLCSASGLLMASDGGPQLKNSTFEGAWETVSKGKEPAGWNSFGTVTGSLAGFAGAEQLFISNIVRPNSSGTQSALIKARSAFLGIIANGNMTTGRINAGSASAANEANYNFTIPGDDAFSQPMTGRPDSLTVWVKYNNSNASHNARVSAIIHDDYGFKEPSSDATNNAHIVATAALDYPATEWRRLTIPFDYDTYASNGKTAQYMLLSFTTNKTPGVGSKTDEVYVDDILLVYKPELTIGQLSAATAEAGATLTLPFTLTGTMSPYNTTLGANSVIAEMSDAAGSFDNPVALGSKVTDTTGELQLTVPANTAEGSYKVRLRSTNYPMIAAEIRDLTVKAAEGGLPPLPEMTPWETINTLPWTDHSLTTDWTGMKEPQGWNAMTVLLDEQLNPSFHYPSAWSYLSDLNGTFVSTENGPIHALMVPFLNVPAGIQKVNLSFDYLSESGAPIMLLVTEGENKRMDAKTFMDAVMGTAGKNYPINPTATNEWGRCTQEINMSDFTSRGLNLVLMIFDGSGSPANYAVRNVQLEDAASVSNPSVNEDKALVYAKDGKLHIANIEESANVDVFAMNGTRVLSKTITSGAASFGLNKGIYIVRVTTASGVQTEKVIIR